MVGSSGVLTVVGYPPSPAPAKVPGLEEVKGWVTVAHSDGRWQVNVCVPNTTAQVVFGFYSEREAEQEAESRRAPLVAAFHAGRQSVEGEQRERVSKIARIRRAMEEGGYVLTTWNDADLLADLSRRMNEPISAEELAAARGKGAGE